MHLLRASTGMGLLTLCLAKLSEGRRQQAATGRARQGRSDRRRGELTLKNLEVLDVGIFCVDIELDSRHGDVEEDAVENLAEGGAGGIEMLAGQVCLYVSSGSVSCCRCLELLGHAWVLVLFCFAPVGPGRGCLPSTALLNLGDVELEEAVQPGDELLPAPSGRQSASAMEDGMGRVGP